MSRVAAFFLLLLLAPAAPATSDSPYVLLFASAKERAIEGLERQRARNRLAQVELGRYKYLVARGAASAEEYDHAVAAANLAELDLRIAQTRVDHAKLSVVVAEKLASYGRRVPLCRRRKQTDENSAGPILKKLTTRPQIKISFEPQNTGTVVKVPELEPPSPPQPPEPPEPPAKPKPPEKPQPDKKPGGGAPAPKPPK